MRERDKQIKLAGCLAIAEGSLSFSILAYKGFRRVMTSDYVILGGFSNAFMEVCQAGSVKCLGGVQQIFHWLDCVGKPPAGAKPACGSALLLAKLTEVLLRLLLTKVTKHIPPQTSPVGSPLAGIWSTLGKCLCKILYCSLYYKARGKFLPKRKNYLNTELVIQFVQQE